MLDLATVRAYVGVPATVLSDADLARMLHTAEGDQRARCLVPEPPDGVTVVVVDMSATAVVNDGVPGTYRVEWGDGKHDMVTVDAAGDGQATHEYDEAGTYNVRAETPQGDLVANGELVVPGTGTMPPARPAELDQALLRRVQREIAAKNLPLGMVGLDASEYGPERLSEYDALVEQHERAYRRVVLA